MADIEIVDRAGNKRAPAKHVHPINNVETIMTMGDMRDCMAHLHAFVANQAKEFAQSSGHADGAFPATFRRVKMEVNEAGMPTQHLINRGLSHRDWTRNMVRSIAALRDRIQVSQFNGQWVVEKLEFWSSIRTVNHDAAVTAGDAEARLALASLSTLGAFTVQQVNLAESGMGSTTSENRAASKYDMEVIGITVTLVDTKNAADVRRELGEIVSSTDMARDAGLASSAAALAGAVNALASIAQPAAVPEEKVHHKTQERMQRLEDAAATAAREKQKVLEEAEAMKAKIAALEAQIAAAKK